GNFMLATVAALVVGKAVITANAMAFLKIFDRAPLIQPILFKTAIYWVATFVTRLVERFMHFSVVDGNGPSGFATYLISGFSSVRSEAWKPLRTSATWSMKPSASNMQRWFKIFAVVTAVGLVLFAGAFAFMRQPS